MVIQKIGKPDSVRVFAVGDAKLRSVEWASPKHLLLVKTDTGRVMNLLGPRGEWAMAFVFDTETTKMRPLMTKLENAMNVIYGEPMIRTVDGRPMVFLQGVRFVLNSGRLALYQTDLSDGVTYLAKEGSIDPSRVCIVGASYGGYAALAGVTLQKDIYRCAASVGGPSDLAKMVGWSRRQGGITAQRYWLRFMGAENIRDEVLDEISPAVLAAQASAPVLLVHGKDDTVVPLEQSRFMADALKKAGREPELVVLEGDDHWLSRGATRLQMLRSVVAFLEKHNPPS